MEKFEGYFEFLKPEFICDVYHRGMKFNSVAHAYCVQKGIDAGVSEIDL